MTAVLWLATYLLHSTVLYAAVILFRRRLARLDAAEMAWRAAALLPLVSSTAIQLWGASLWTFGIGAPADRLAESGLGVVSNSPSVVTLASALTVVWLAFGTILVVRDWVAHWLFVRRLGIRHPAEGVPMSVVADVARHAGLSEPVRVTHSRSAASPVALGRSEICLPSRALRDLRGQQFRVLIAHEVAHLCRRDAQWFAVLAWLESAMFVQPLNRIARRELQKLAEMSCDQWAASESSGPAAMANCLIEVASWSRGAPPDTAPGVVGRSGLAERVRRLLEAPGPKHGPSRVLCLAAVVTASVLLPGIVRPSTVSSRSSSLESQSPSFIAGYQAGRRFARDRATAGTQTGLEWTHDPTAVPSQEWRAELERTLQARQARR